MTTPPDRLRALDQVEPPDAWTDISRRAEGPIDLLLAPANAARRRPALLVAAAILVLATIAGVAAFATRSGDDGRPVASNGGPTTTPAGLVAPAAARAADSFWGRQWTVIERFDRGDAALPVIATIQGAPVLDAQTEGMVFFTGCNGAGARVRLSDARLIQQEELPHHDMGCMPPDRMAQDDWFAALLAEGPTIAIDGRRLTLATASGKRVELVDMESSGAAAGASSLPPVAIPTIPAPDSGGSSSSPVLPPGAIPGSVPPSGPSAPGGPIKPSGPIAPGGPIEPSGPTPVTTTTFPAIAQQADGLFFGHYWQVSQMTDGRSDPGFSGAVVDTSQVGQVTVRGCNGAGGAMHLDGDRLRVGGPWVHTAMGCVSTDGTDRSMQQDEWFDSFLRAEPTVAVSGRNATLTTSTATVSLRLP
jgi:heat shock protein HslJ